MDRCGILYWGLDNFNDFEASARMGKAGLSCYSFKNEMV